MRIEKEERVDGTDYKYSSEWINKLEPLDHWKLYWFQQKWISNKIAKGSKILEIGVGSGFCANYLSSKGYIVTTFDIDPEKKPDIIGNIVQFNSILNYEAILAFEVFEHIPYDKFIATLINIRKNTNKIFFSVPINKVRLIDLEIRLPLIKRINFSIYYPIFAIKESHHFWEVGFKGYDLKRIKKDICLAGFKVLETKSYKAKMYFEIQ